MSGIYGFSFRRAEDPMICDALGGLSHWNQIYGREAHDRRVLGASALGCHIEHFSERFPYGGPVLEHDGSYAVVDALIYNRDELLPLLEPPADSGISDEELLLSLIRSKGFDSLSGVNGDFAGAIYDAAQNTWTIFRDHMGVRPLYLYRDADLFAFSTDLRGLIAIPGTDASPNERPIYYALSGMDFFSLQETEFQFISCARPGSVTSVCLTERGFEWEQKPYWNIREKKIRLGSDKAYERELYRLISDAVNRRCDAIPGLLGAELSGGLDSGVIDILINRHGREARFYSWSDDPSVLPLCEELDERQVILDICRQEGINCHFQTHEDVRRSRSNTEKVLPPFVNTQRISHGSNWLREQGAKVVFSGHGGDEGVSHRASRYELFYNHEYLAYFKLYYQDLAGKPLRLLRALRSGLLDARDRRERIREAVSQEELPESVFDRDFSDRMRPSCPKMERYFNYAPHRYIMQGGSRSRLDNAAYQGAANGVRYLFPYVDHRVIDFAVSVPRRLYIRSDGNRVLFREAFRDIMPQSLYQVDYKDAPSLRNAVQDDTDRRTYICGSFAYLLKELDRDRWSGILDFEKIGYLTSVENLKDMKRSKLYLLIHHLGCCLAIQKLQDHARDWRDPDGRSETV